MGIIQGRYCQAHRRCTRCARRAIHLIFPPCLRQIHPRETKVFICDFNIPILWKSSIRQYVVVASGLIKLYKRRSVRSLFVEGVNKRHSACDGSETPQCIQVSEVLKTWEDTTTRQSRKTRRRFGYQTVRRNRAFSDSIEVEDHERHRA